MAVISSLSYGDLRKEFVYRVKKTNLLKRSVETSEKKITGNLDLEIQIYFKYYFDVYTAIERTVRSIAHTLSSKSKYIFYHSQASLSTKPYLISVDELKGLLERKPILTAVLTSSNFLKTIAKSVDIIEERKKVYNILNEEDFFEKYNQLRTDRNNLAHGLESTNTVDFSEGRLLNNLNVFYVLLNFHKRQR